MMGEYRGRGEASGVYYLGDTSPTMVAEIEAARREIEKGIDRTAFTEAFAARRRAKCRGLRTMGTRRPSSGAWRFGSCRV